MPLLPSPPPPPFLTHAHSEWVLQRTESLASEMFAPEAGEKTKYVMSARGDSLLVGKMYAEADLVDESNAEDEFDEVMATGAVGWKHVADIRVEFDDASGSHGEFKAAAVDESDDAGFVTLFAFDFAPMSRDVPTPISQGAYAPDRVYEFAFHSGTTFTLTTVGIDVNEAEIGERWQVGEVLLEVRSVRTPCNDFKVWMGRTGYDSTAWVRRFAQVARPGP